MSFEEVKSRFEQAKREALPKILAIYDNFEAQWGFPLASEAIPSQEISPDMIALREKEYGIPTGSIAAGFQALQQVEALLVDPADFTSDLSEQIDLLSAQ